MLLFLSNTAWCEVPQEAEVKKLRFSLAVGPQYSLFGGTNPSLTQSSALPIGFGVFTNWHFSDPHSLELGVTTIYRSVTVINGGFLTTPIAQTSIQLQILYRYQILTSLNLGLGGHFDYNPLRMGWLFLPADALLVAGYTDQIQNQWNYGLTISAKYEPNLHVGPLSPFIDLRYLYSFRNISEGVWGGRTMDTKVSQIQLFLGFTYP